MYKIKVPNEAVSEAVQNKAFKDGYYWANTQKGVKDILFLQNSYLFLVKKNFIDYEVYPKNGFEEISWQEYLYGEGSFFYCEGNKDLIYYWSVKNKTAYWAHTDGATIKRSSYEEEYFNYGWFKCDKDGNNLEENNMEQEFTKKDLVSGVHIVEHTNGKIGIIMGSNIVYANSFNDLCCMREDLKNFQNKEDWDIEKVFTYLVARKGLNGILDKDNLKLIWERKEETKVLEVTMEELEKHYGAKVKIVNKGGNSE